MSDQRTQSLGFFLKQIETKYHRTDLLSSDPLEFVHRYRDPLDQEVVALFAAVLAYGNVKQIRKSVQDWLDRVGRIQPLGPAAWIQSLGRAEVRSRSARELESFVHRFNRGPDLLVLAELLHDSWKKHGSLGAHLGREFEQTCDLPKALDQMLASWKALRPEALKTSFSYFLTAPADGSCCKRWCMFLRWMIRKDDLDLGIWQQYGLHPRDLVIPLDTHTGRISQYLHLTRRNSLNWKAAVEVTQALKAVDPEDPVRFDFALARLGILKLCQKKFKKEICQKCDLIRVCHYAQRRKAHRE